MVYSGKQKPLWVNSKERKFTTWCWFQMSKKDWNSKREKRGRGSWKKYSNRSEASVPLSWSPQVCPSCCVVGIAITVGSGPAKEVPLVSEMGSPKDGKATAVQNAPSPGATTPVASNCCISTAQSRKLLFLFLIYQFLLLIESNRKPAARKEACKILLAEFPFHQ